METKIPLAAGEQTKFNMALATLESVSNLLTFYNKVSIMDSVELNDKIFRITDTLEAQIIKSRTCNQLLMTSRVLLTDDQKKELEKELKQTQIKYHEIKDSKGIIKKRFKAFHQTVNDACDKFVSLLVDNLQANGIFMPKKGEQSLF